MAAVQAPGKEGETLGAEAKETEAGVTQGEVEWAAECGGNDDGSTERRDVKDVQIFLLYLK